MQQATEDTIRLAVMSLGWGSPTGEDFIPFLKEVKAAGYEGVTGFADTAWWEYIGEPGEFRRMLDGEGLVLASMDVQSGAELDRVRQICASMAELDCHHLVCLGGVGTAVDTYEALGPVLERIGEIALGFDIRAAYHNGRTRETIANMETVLGHSDPEKVFAMCDTGHATRDFVELPHAERAVRFMEKHWDHMDFIEFKDWNEETELNTPVGEGLCGWEAVFELIKTKTYRGWITVEQNGSKDGLSLGRDAMTCATISRNFIREGLGV